MARGVFHRRSGRQAADDGQPPPAPVIQRTLLAVEDPFRADRRCDVECSTYFEPDEPPRRNADDLEWMPIEHHDFADHGGIAAVLPLPEGVREYDGRSTASWLIVARRQQTAEMWPDAEYVEQIAAHPEALNELHVAAH